MIDDSESRASPSGRSGHFRAFKIPEEAPKLADGWLPKSHLQHVDHLIK